MIAVGFAPHVVGAAEVRDLTTSVMGQEISLPVVIITRVDDAKRAVDAGVSAIAVSNHGGNNLDGSPATIRRLPAVADAVGDDVVKAVALGAREIGRAYLWGLAANGQAGVENVLDILRGGIDSGLIGLGKATVHDVNADDVLMPDGFALTLGSPNDQCTHELAR